MYEVSFQRSSCIACTASVLFVCNGRYLYSKGLGIEKDPKQAAEWYRKAAEQGFAESQVHLGFAYQEGSGVEKNDALAMEWYRKAAIQNDDYAKYAKANIKAMIDAGRGDGKAP